MQKSRGEPNVVLRTVVLAAAYVLVTGGLLAALLWQLRNEAVVASERELSAFAQLTAGHTFEVVRSAEESLQLAEMTLAVATDSGAADEESIRLMLRDVVRNARVLQDILVLDAQGRVIHQAQGNAAIGQNRATQPYFTRFRSDPTLKFEVGTATRDGSATADVWSIPMAHVWRNGKGEFAGVVIGFADPAYFERAWTFKAELPGLGISLTDHDGGIILRRPFAATMVGRPLVEAPPQLRLEEASGAAGVQSEIDGRELLLAWQRVAGYPSLLVFVSQPIEIVLGSWWRFATITGACWLAASLALGALGAWLGRVIRARGLLEDRYRALFDSIPHPVIVSDEQTSRILAFNEAAGHHYGWAADAADNEQLRLPADLALLAEHRANLSEERAVVVEGQRQRNSAGQLLDVDLTLRRIEYDRRRALLTIAVDVTSRKVAERARQAAEDRLRQTQRMELMGQLTGGVAHDFNNILMVIEGNVESLLERRDGDPETVRLLAQISDSAQHAEDLTRQMLAFSRKLPLRPRPTDLNDLVVETGKLLRRTLGEQIEIDSILADDLWRVDIDRAQLETSLANLCVNARDAMPRGGRVLIETRNVHLDPGSASAQQAGASGDCVVLSVTDTGEGIPPEILDKIFEPFFTTKTTGRNSGLGLSMVYGFVRQSKGHIEVTSEPGRGTVVRIYLPRSLEAAQVLRGAPAIRGGTERVLVAEDDEAVRSSVVRQLRSLGYAVTGAPDGDAALAAFERPDAVFDLLLTDVIMPGAYNGNELATEVLRRWPRTKVVFMSGYTDNALGDRDVLLLAKPFRKADLATILRAAIEGEVASTTAS